MSIISKKIIDNIKILGYTKIVIIIILKGENIDGVKGK